MGLRGLHREQGWRAEEELKVHVATVGCLGNVVAGTPDRLLSGNLARQKHEGFAATAPQLAIDASDTELPETAAWHLV